MASTYGNDLRLEEIGDGEQSGTWGATTNTNLELIAEALSFGTEAITTNADTHTTTIADGATDPGRSLYLKYTGTLDSTCTITIAPNSISKTWYIENGTSGSQSIIISQGSGANVTIPTGQTKVVYSDGAGSGAAMAEIGTLGVTNLNVSGDITVGDDLTVTDDMTVGGTLGVTGVLTGTSLDISGNIDIDGTTNLDAVDIDGAVQIDATVNVGVDDTGYDVKFFGDTASAYMQWDASADDLILGGAAGLVVPDGKLTLGSTAVTSTGAELNILDGVTSTTAELNILDGVTSTATEINQLDAITRGSILYGNASGATARLAKGAASTFLFSDGTDLSWAAVSAGYEQVKFPSDWTSPDETFNSSGTYTKPGSVADTDFIWIYLVGGGGAGCSSGRTNGTAAGNSAGYVGGSAGGSAFLLYGQAKIFTGGAMVIGAAYPFSSRPVNQFFYDPVQGNPSTFTLTSNNGGAVYSTNTGADNASARVIQIPGQGSESDDYLHSSAASTTDFSLDTATTPALSANAFIMGSINSGNNVPTTQQTSVFAGGNAGAKPYNYGALPTIAQGTSVLSGAGGILNSTDGQFPGGAGRSVTGSGVGGDGAAGQIRIYHV
mgnify:CR=1 FL=1